MEVTSMTELQVRLGKQEYEHNPLTIMLARYLLPEIRTPTRFDFDTGRRPFPMRMWGNNAWGDCVIAGRCNHILRLERIEQRRTIALFDDDAISEYQKLTGSQTPEDANDTGLGVLDAMREWKNTGMMTDGRNGVRLPRNYQIAAYGEIEPQDHQQLKMAIYAMHGIHMGFWLPRAAQSMTNQGVWDYQGQSGPEWQPGSWGGHLVYSKAFDTDTVEILTWAEKVKVTWNFLDKYCDESWAVVDSFDSWRTKQTIDVAGLIAQLHQISKHVNE
jgi:hypothetical protein